MSRCESQPIPCYCEGSTYDHHTPQCIGKLDHLGFVKHSSTNRQMLCRPCHNAKDKDTPHRLALRRQQKNGRRVTLQDLKKYRMEITVEHSWDEGTLAQLLYLYRDNPEYLQMIKEGMEEFYTAFNDH